MTVLNKRKPKLIQVLQMKKVEVSQKKSTLNETLVSNKKYQSISVLLSSQVFRNTLSQFVLFLPEISGHFFFAFFRVPVWKMSKVNFSTKNEKCFHPLVIETVFKIERE